MRTRLSLLLILLILLGTLSPVAASATHSELSAAHPKEGARVYDSLGNPWNLAHDFDDLRNPSGSWEYGWKASLDSPFERFTQSGTSGGRPYWNASNNAIIWKNTSTQTVYGVKPGQVSLHPGASGEYAVVRWTAPARMRVVVIGEFGAGDSAKLSFYFQVNGQVRFQDRSTATVRPEPFYVDVNPGDVIDALVGEGYTYGNTPLQLAIALVSAPGQGSYDLVRDFDSISNPSGTWEYGWKASKDGTFQRFTETGINPNGVRYWTAANGANIWRNTSSQTLYGVAPGEVSLHPGAGGQYAVVRWTAPAAMHVQLHAEFLDGDIGVMQGYIQINGVVKYTQTDLSPDPLIKIKAGDQIDVLVGDGYNFGNTPVRLQIFQIGGLISDFDSVNNPSGPWEYGWKATLDGPFQRFTQSGKSENGPYWNAPNNAIIWQNTSAQVVYGVQPPQVALHPGVNSEYATARWTAPRSGLMDVFGYFAQGDIGLVHCYILLNGQVLRDYSDQGWVDFPLALNAGDTLDFMVGEGYDHGNTQVNFEIWQAGNPILSKLEPFCTRDEWPCQAR